MGKSLYVLKMYILSHLFARLTPRQLALIQRLTLFIVTLFGKYFLQSSLPSSAPQIDLNFYHDVCTYSNIDNEIGTACLKSIKRHLWYLMPEYVFLSLFDPMLSIDEKQLLAVTLLSHNFSDIDEFEPGKPDFQNPLLVLNSDERQSLSEFITKDTWFLFNQCSKFLERNNNICSLA